MTLFRLFLSLFLVFSFGAASFAEPTGPTRSLASVSESAPLFAREVELASEIDRQADVVFKKFVEESGTHVPLTTLQKAKRIAIYRLRQMNILTDILKAAGPAPATALLASEILTNFVLAPIATAFGKPAVAGVMITVPWGVIAGFGVFSVQVAKERFQIARSLGRFSLGSLDRLREIVIGYDVKHRVSSVIYQALNSELTEFEVLKKGWAFETAKQAGVLVSELEDIVKRDANGAAYLEAIYLEKLDPSFYSALLLRFINESESLTVELVSTVRSRMPAVTASTDPLALRRHLIGIDDVKMQLDRDIRNLQKMKAALKKRFKSGEISEFQRARLKVEALAEISRLQRVRDRLVRHEYAVLVQAEGHAVNGLALTSLKIEAARSEELVQLALEAHVRPPKSGIAAVGAARSAPSERIQAVARAVSARALLCQDLF